jgi:DNA replication and repair protein RecF
VEPAFLDAWRRYHRLVRQRNAALKVRSVAQLGAWDRELAVAGECLSEYRQKYTEALGLEVSRIGNALLGSTPNIVYRQGWSENSSLLEALGESRQRDLKFGVTHAGPHRADASIQLACRKARGRVSRGQQKLLAATLVLAQLAHLRSARNLRSILLLDDLAAELDPTRLEKVREVVCSLDVQVFLTALQRSDLAAWKCSAMFHVEQGRARSVL